MICLATVQWLQYTGVTPNKYSDRKTWCFSEYCNECIYHINISSQNRGIEGMWVAIFCRNGCDGYYNIRKQAIRTILNIKLENSTL